MTMNNNKIEEKINLVDTNRLFNLINYYQNLNELKESLECVVDQIHLTNGADDLIREWMAGEIKYSLRQYVPLKKEKLKKILQFQHHSIVTLIAERGIHYEWGMVYDIKDRYIPVLNLYKEYDRYFYLTHTYVDDEWVEKDQEWLSFLKKRDRSFIQSVNAIKRNVEQIDTRFLNALQIEDEQVYWFEKYLVNKILDIYEHQ